MRRVSADEIPLVDGRCSAQAYPAPNPNSYPNLSPNPNLHPNPNPNTNPNASPNPNPNPNANPNATLPPTSVLAQGWCLVEEGKDCRPAAWPWPTRPCEVLNATANQQGCLYANRFKPRVEVQRLCSVQGLSMNDA